MPTASSSRRPASANATTTTRLRQNKATTPDALADALASKLTISKKKPETTKSRTKPDTAKSKAEPKLSPQQRRVAAMHAVNEASQGLSAIVQSASKSKANGGKLWENARNALRALRELDSDGADVERAASSIIGKLVVLEMLDASANALMDMRPAVLRLCSQDAHDSEPPSLPIPEQLTTELASDINRLTVLSTYLLYAVYIHANTLIQPSSSDTSSETHARRLLSSATLLQWIPHLAPCIPSPQLAPILTKAYTLLTRVTAGRSSTHPRTTFALRTYALLVLLHTAPTADAFWDQTTRVVQSFLQNLPTDDLAGSLDCFERVAERARECELAKGCAYASFCEYWMEVAKRAGDRNHVERAARCVKTLSASTSSLPEASSTPGEGPLVWDADPAETARRARKAGEKIILNSAKVCTALGRATVALEQDEQDLEPLTEAHEALRGCAPLLACSTEEATSADVHRACTKVRRALDKLRRAAMKVLDDSMVKDMILKILDGTVDVLEEAIKQERSDELVAPAIETIFLLARRRLVPASVSSVLAAFALLERARAMVSDAAGERGGDYVRCVSGAYHNLGGTLYQAAQYAHALRFLERGAVLGETALRMYAGREGEWKQAGSWRQLVEQEHRRWEFVGACYMKLGDRKAACIAFVGSVAAYPFAETDFVAKVKARGAARAFMSSPALTQLGTIIDRATYIAALELFRSAEEVSMRQALGSLGLDVVGAVVERQLESLQESRWKDGMGKVLDGLMDHLLEVYTKERPIRRARVLLRRMEMSFYGGKAGQMANEDGQEIRALLAQASFGADEELKVYRDEIIVSTHLWLALHAHREERISDCLKGADDAWQLARKAVGLGEPASGSPVIGKKKPPVKGKIPQAVVTRKKAPASKAPASSAVRTRAAASKAPPPTRTRVSRAVKEPVTPKARSVLEPVSINGDSPTKTTELSKQLAIDDIPKLMSLIEMTSELLGLIGHIPLRLKLLTLCRRLCELDPEDHIETLLRTVAALGHDYARLGKTNKAGLIFARAHDLLQRNKDKVSDDIHVMFLLRYAEALALKDDTLTSAGLYCEAAAISGAMLDEDKHASTVQRIRTRIRRLARAATAAGTYAAIQACRGDPNEGLVSLLKSLRLWNRAIEAMSRMAPQRSSSPAPADDNPFAMTGLKEALPDPDSDIPVTKAKAQKAIVGGWEWSLSRSLLDAMFAIGHAYLLRGSAREALYFTQQAEELATSLSAPAMVGRALARQGEIQLHMAKLEEARASLARAAQLVHDLPGIDAADVRRLDGDVSRLHAEPEEARAAYDDAVHLLDTLDQSFVLVDGMALNRRRSSLVQTQSVGGSDEVLLPKVLASVLRRHIWLLREHSEEDAYRVLLDKFMALPSSAELKAEQNNLMAKLTLHDVFSRFKTDISLSSFGESAIAIPMGMSSTRSSVALPVLQEIFGTLATAEQLWWTDLATTATKGSTLHVRESSVSLAFVQALQASLGRNGHVAPLLAARLLDAAACLTLCREMVEVSAHKYPDVTSDDLCWSLMTPIGTPLGSAPKKQKSRFMASIDSDDEGDEHVSIDDEGLKAYWRHIHEKYQKLSFDSGGLSTSRIDNLPENWIVINIGLSDDKNTMFIARQRKSHEPLMFCLPLKGRRDSDDEDHMGFEDAIAELRDIIRSSDQATKDAVNVRKDDKQARANWWAGRSALDKRLQELLENIEFCWLGAFKTILSRPTKVSPENLDKLRDGFEKVFKRGLIARNKKEMSRVKLNDALVECFSNLSPQCRDEELEDLVYFVLDLYQFNGVAVSVSEVDVDQVAVDLRSVLEEHSSRVAQTKPERDSHIFLVLDKDLQGIPWESIPIMRGASVSRVPCVEFLLDRLHLEGMRRGNQSETIDRATVDPRNGMCILNPSGDLTGTEKRFGPWVKEMKTAGWQSVVGKAPSEQQFLDALSRQDLVVYFGHGGGEQYVRSHKIRNLPRCAATLLWGCSSGALKEMGDFDRVGTPYNYMVAGCPTLVANLWDVTDRDIDKFSQAVFDKLRLNAADVKGWTGADAGRESLVAAVAEAREVCKLKYLTGAAPVVYGIPFYL